MCKRTLYYFLGNKKYPEIYVLHGKHINAPYWYFPLWKCVIAIFQTICPKAEPRITFDFVHWNYSKYFHTSNYFQGWQRFICFRRFCHAPMKLILNDLMFMICTSVLSQCISWPEGFSTEVARNAESLHMVCFNVVSYVFSFPLFSTHFANVSFSATVIWTEILALCHHWFHSFVQFL